MQPAAAAEPAGVSGFIFKFMRILHSGSRTHRLPQQQPRKVSAYPFILGLCVPWLLHRVTLGRAPARGSARWREHAQGTWSHLHSGLGGEKARPGAFRGGRGGWGGVQQPPTVT